ncbi:MAG: hypothetical protein AB8G99_03965 [Planctomycetaceae bacterium]
MAKKSSGVNMSEEIRKILGDNPQASNSEIYQQLVKKFGKGKLNEDSCGVAASIQRKKLGINKGKRKAVRKAKPAVRTNRPASKVQAAGTAVDYDVLKSAKSLLTAVGGDESAAIAAIRQLNSLQIG